MMWIWKGEKGMTLIEVMVAILIISIVAASILISYNLSYKIARINTHRTQAIQLARRTIEAERNMGFRPTATAAALCWGPVADTTIINMMTDVVVTDSPPVTRIVDVTVRWTEEVQPMMETLTTAVVRR